MGKVCGLGRQLQCPSYVAILRAFLRLLRSLIAQSEWLALPKSQRMSVARKHWHVIVMSTKLHHQFWIQLSWLHTRKFCLLGTRNENEARTSSLLPSLVKVSNLLQACWLPECFGPLRKLKAQFSFSTARFYTLIRSQKKVQFWAWTQHIQWSHMQCITFVTPSGISDVRFVRLLYAINMGHVQKSITITYYSDYVPTIPTIRLLLLKPSWDHSLIDPVAVLSADNSSLFFFWRSEAVLAFSSHSFQNPNSNRTNLYQFQSKTIRPKAFICIYNALSLSSPRWICVADTA